MAVRHFDRFMMSVGGGSSDRPAAESVLAALVGAAALAVYQRTLCPGIYVGDSGELIAAAATLGIPHPTGYPLYLLLGKLFLLLVPAGSVAWRLNLFSALCAAAAAGVLVLALRAHGLRRPAAAAGGLVLAFSLSLWSQATCARVYALQALLAVLALHFTLAFVRTRTPRALYAFALTAGFAAANHSVVIVQMVVMALVVAIVCPAVFARLRVVATTVLLLLPGLSLYLYLPLRSRMDPVLDWGNPETPALFWRFITRATFWKLRYVTGWADLPVVSGRYLRLIPEEFAWSGAVALGLGIVILARRRRMVLLVCLATYLLNVALLAVHGSWADVFQWSRYAITGLMALTVVVACALDAAAGWLAAVLRWRGATALASVVVLALPAHLLLRHHPEQDRSRHTLASDYGRAVLKAVPRGATLLAYGDNLAFPLLALHAAEGLRGDLRLILPQAGQLVPGSIDPHRPVYSTRRVEIVLDGVAMIPVPEGEVFRLVPRGLPWPLRPPEERIPLRRFDAPSPAKDFLSRALIGEYFLRRGSVYAELGEHDKARESLRTAAAIAFDVPQILHFVGRFYQQLGRIDEAVEAHRAALRLNPKRREDEARLRDLAALRAVQSW